MHSLVHSDRMKLSELEICMIRSFMDVDEEDNVHYKQAARMIGELIKRFFSPKMMQLKVKPKFKITIRKDSMKKGWSCRMRKSQDGLTRRSPRTCKWPLLCSIRTKTAKLTSMSSGNASKSMSCLLAFPFIYFRICFWRITDQEVESKFKKACVKNHGILDRDEFEKAFFMFIMSMRTIKEIEKL